jgi:tRNA 2-thiocytidine biosynthesis protein TtcA
MTRFTRVSGAGDGYRYINRDIGKAVQHYRMIEDGDRILVGVSGGKDSLTLLWALDERRSRIPVSYALYGVYVDPGFELGFAPELSEWCRRSGFSLRVEYTDCGVLAHSETNRENPCFLCARLRRKRIFEVAEELNCNKVAFGHHKDDIIETFFINICYAGAMYTMRPKQTFFDGKITVIRPLTFVDESSIRRFADTNEFPKFDNPCPTAKTSKRKEIKTLLKQLYRNNRNIKGNIFRSLGRVKPEYFI